jgi:hypothetical protein
MRSECDQYLGRQYQLCTGTAEGVTIELMNAWRAKRGLGPLTDSDVEASRTAAIADPPIPASKPKSLMQRVITFAGARRDHLQDGMAKCEQHEIEARLKICEQCPSFTGTHCRECGCACGGNATFFNKLAWRSERCPLGHW